MLSSFGVAQQSKCSERETMTQYYWYWYRQTTPRPAGSWVISGPYETRESALSNRKLDKRDGDVGVPFISATKEEAESKTSFQG